MITVERTELVEEFLSSFDFPARAEIDAAWSGEAEGRIDACARGDVTAIPASRVFEKIDKKYSG